MTTITALSVQEITDAEQWNTFLTSQPRGHLLQSYEWGELNKYLGGRIYRLGALEDGRLIGAMLLTVAPVPLPVRVPGLQLNWLYSVRGPTVERPDSPALAALITHAHTVAKREHAVVLRVEPNIADDDPDEHGQREVPQHGTTAEEQRHHGDERRAGRQQSAA